MSLRSFKRKTGRNEQKEMGGGLTEFLFFLTKYALSFMTVLVRAIVLSKSMTHIVGNPVSVSVFGWVWNHL